MEKHIIIGITKHKEKWKNYSDWIKNGEKEIEVRILSHEEKNLSDIEKCDGFIFSGGEDVHPEFYNKPAYLKAGQYKIYVDEKRDEFEKMILEKALQSKKPVLGICRGLQFINVFFGGTLIPDLLFCEHKDHSKTKENDRLHNITIAENSLLGKITGVPGAIVNSAHHQAADIIGKELVVSASSDDDVTEALEFQDKKDKPFLLAVQWHPERMLDRNNPCTQNVRMQFLKACKKQ